MTGPLIEKERNTMRSILRAAVMALIAALGTSASLADETNVVQTLDFQLNGFQQGASKTNGNVISTRVAGVRVRTRDVINALSSATGVAFSKSASLVVVTPLGGGTSSIQIRDGTTTVDVTTFFSYQAVGGVVSASETNLRTGRAAGDDFSIQAFTLTDSPGYNPLGLHFDLRGLAEQTWTTTAQGTRTELSAEVTGSGDSNGNTLIFQGLVRVHGYSLEILSGGWTT